MIAGEDREGEVELEQAYLDLELSDRNRIKAGLFLVPVGILNETHEPATFYGVERNRVENSIIPSTWWEAGAAFTSQLPSGISYDIAVHSGLNVPTTGHNAFSIRSGRQKVSEAFLCESFPERAIPSPSVLWLTSGRKETVREILGHDYRTFRIRYWRDGDKTAWILEEIEKYKPITTGIVVENGKISR